MHSGASKPIKIAFDMFVLGQGIKTGVYRVCDELFCRLGQSGSFLPLAVLRSKEFESAAKEYLLTRHLDWTWIACDDADQADVLVLSFLSPWEPWASNKKVLKVFIAYDLIAIFHPEYFENQLSDLVAETYRKLPSDSLVVCISEKTKSDLLLFRGDIPPENIIVIPLAAGPQFVPCVERAQIESIRRKYAIPSGVPYFLSLATLEIRKNLLHVVKAFAAYIKKNPESNVHLVLSGMQGWKLESLEQEIAKLGITPGRIVLTGFVADEHLAALYSGATAFLYMSRYEGFGLPPLEAMACGTPVITSNTSSLPEVVGSSGILLDPNDESGLVLAMHSLLCDASLCCSLSRSGLERARSFSWERAVQLISSAILKRCALKPKLSIITICYNEPHIEDTCRSIVAQKWKDFEWIVVDGGSTDGSLSVLERYKDYISFLVSEKDEGRYDAMNKGIAIATGEFVLFLNGGDYLVSEETLNNIFNYKPIPKLENYTNLNFDADIMYGEVLARETGMMPWPIWTIGPQSLDLDYFDHHSLPHQATFIRRKMFDRCGLYDSTLNFVGDYEWFMRAIFRFNASSCYIPCAISVYNFEGVSSGSPDACAAHIIENRRVYEKYKDTYKKQEKKLPPFEKKF